MDRATCPRGHAVLPGATRCTVCGIHVAEAPSVDATPSKPARRRRTALILAGSAAVAVALGIGWLVGWGPSTMQAAPAAESPGASVTSDPAITVTVPQPGTLATDSPSAASTDRPSPLAVRDSTPLLVASGCAVLGRDIRTSCVPEGDLVAFDVCLPTAAADLAARTRADAFAPWKAPATRPVRGGSAVCLRGEGSVHVVLKVRDGVRKEVRLSARDAAGPELARVDATVTRADAAPAG